MPFAFNILAARSPFFFLLLAVTWHAVRRGAALGTAAFAATAAFTPAAVCGAACGCRTRRCAVVVVLTALVTVVLIEVACAVAVPNMSVFALDSLSGAIERPEVAPECHYLERW